MADLIISSSSRYKDTELVSIDGQQMFGLFVLPEEFTGDPGTDPQVSYDTLGDGQSPFLDILAVRSYGPGNESLWWIIAAATGIIDPDRDIDSNTQCTIPSFDVVNAFRARAPQT